MNGIGLTSLGAFLEQTPEFRLLRDELRAETVDSCVHILPDALPFVLANLWETLNIPVLVVTPRPDDARRLVENLSLWSSNDELVLHFPETETLPYERLLSDMETTRQRLQTLAKLGDENCKPPIVVASTTALTQKTIGRPAFNSACRELRRGQQVVLAELIDSWSRMGYEFVPTVYAPGSASRRGGILDVYPINCLQPVRIELWDDVIDSIRIFDPLTQRSTEVIDSVLVVPTREMLPAIAARERVNQFVSTMDLSNCSDTNRERITNELTNLMDGYLVEEASFYSGFFNHGSLLDYFPKNSLLVLYRPSEITAVAKESQIRALDLRKTKQSRGEVPFGFPSAYLSWHEVEEYLVMMSRRIEVMAWGAATLERQQDHFMPCSPSPSFPGQINRFVEQIGKETDQGHTVVAITAHSRRLGEIFRDSGIHADIKEAMLELPSPGSITILQSKGVPVPDGFKLSTHEGELAVFGDGEIFGVIKQRRTIRNSRAKQQSVLSQFNKGDYLVHVEHGIGRFVTTGRIDGDDQGREYLILSYAHGDKLYVPMEHLDRVTSYVAPLDRPPTLTRLGTQEWKRAKEKAENSTKEMAAELLSLYAARELVDGHSYSKDATWQAELEEAFPFEETVDQLETISRVKTDMESAKPMDRLVCGDVGYGKTEIALRAAFKAVMGGRQVAVLVPTTVLAQQHYATFAQRLGAYPVSVEVLSRFRSQAEQSKIIGGLSNGSIDICIGTHRIVQKDVKFKDLGLVVVDEEQRFGVAHKERLKQMRREVDVLTLTATPIPRTLHMAMAGVRDMSIMESPPEERLPIKTYVSEFSDDLIREAILRELDRQGQTYFVHNRVHNIDRMASSIQDLVPEASIDVAHGQMPENQLEQTMMRFAKGESDVLVCTTIIESGLDIPNVNTLIVNRADAFGLAQMYQLRGRVGRSARRAYSYLLVPQAKSLTNAAENRLKAMLTLTDLGSGFQIAMKDLEIRGAGNILGSEQSGHIHAIGFDLYTKMLSLAVEELRARRHMDSDSMEDEEVSQQSVIHAPETTEELEKQTRPEMEASVIVEVGLPASLPEEYIEDLSTRLGIYRRLVNPSDQQIVDELEIELRDRFGALPLPVNNLLYIARLKLLARRACVESISLENSKLVLRLKDQVGGAKDVLKKLLGDEVEIGNSLLRMDPYRINGGWEEFLVDVVCKLGDFMEKVHRIAK